MFKARSDRSHVQALFLVLFPRRRRKKTCLNLLVERGGKSINFKHATSYSVATVRNQRNSVKRRYSSAARMRRDSPLLWILSVVGDNYAGEWPISMFKTHGIAYEKATKNKSEL
jgi:hypothetical protein